MMPTTAPTTDFRDELEIYPNSEVEVIPARNGGALVTLDRAPIAAFGRLVEANDLAAELDARITEELAELGVQMQAIPIPRGVEQVHVNWHVPTPRFEALLDRIVPDKEPRNFDGGRTVDFTIGGVDVTMFDSGSTNGEQRACASAIAQEAAA